MTVTSMLDKVLKIATRQSPLALWQAQYVKARLEQAHPGLKVELVPMVTRGDVILDTPLAKVGGKGLFVKELELAMLEGRADIAVHSMKDVPVEFPEGLGLVTICERDDPRDAFVSNRYASIDELPAGSVVGTSSLRRQCQLAATRPDLAIRSLRGNVGTRLSKLDNGEYDAIILAAAGLKRLQLEARIRQPLSPEQSLPAVGQGAVGIECRLDDAWTRGLLAPLNHTETAVRVRAERAMNTRLEGGCQVPIGSYAELKDGELWLRALVGAPDGSQLVRGERRGPAEQAEALGISLAEELLDNGAREILAAVYDGEARDEHPGHSSTTARRSAGQPSAGHGTRGLELSADRIYAWQGASRAGRCACPTGARRSAICAIPACGGIRPCPSAAAGPALAHFSALFCHWPHDGAGPAYGQWAAYPLPVRSGN